MVAKMAGYRELTHRVGELLSEEPLGSPVELDLVLLVPEPVPFVFFEYVFHRHAAPVQRLHHLL